MTTFKFDAEIGKVLHLVINSIYTNKEIFLRELISNASDAINKRKYLSLSDSSVSLSEDGAIKIKILRDEKALLISDNGIGMNEEELIKNIGTIANSGTFKFIENLKNANSNEVSPENMIGQFGVGFYSAFMIANHIEVKTRKASSSDVFLWKSDGKENFTIEKITDENFAEGTQIKMFLMPEMEEEFLDKFRLEHIIKTYSNHITFPISLEHEEGIEGKVNNAQPLWASKPSEISKEQYIEFYNSISYSGDAPFLTMHNKIEGTQEYTNLLFIPSKRPFDLYNPERKTSIKLYVKKVFITEESIKLLPEYLRFVKGVVDSSDLPLNISRETLQNSEVLNKIGKSITKKIFAELQKKLKEDKESYISFWKEFGNVIKEGLCRPEDLKDQIMESCLFYSSLKNDYVTLAEYIERMQPEQENIYYLTADAIEDGMESAGLEAFKKSDIEVLILTDTVDDFWVTVATEYKGKDIKNINSSDKKTDELLSKTLEQQDDESDESKKAIEIFKSALSGLVREVKISHKLNETPTMLVSGSDGMSIRMEKYLMEQKQLHTSSKKIMEINLKHPIVQSIIKQGETEETKEIILNLFDISCVASGEALRSNSDFTKRMFAILKK